METISYEYEQSYIRTPHAGELPCLSGSQCVGCTFCSYEGKRLGRCLTEFVTPLGKSFDHQCVLCIRKNVTSAFYNILYEHELPQTSIIHPYMVEVDNANGYNADSCLFPPTCGPNDEFRFVGLVGPFPRFNELSLCVENGTIVQRNVRYRTMPTLLKAKKRYGARRVDFFFDTTSAVILAGYICNVNPSKTTIDVVDIFKRCVPKRNNQKLCMAKYDQNKVIMQWLEELFFNTTRGVYPYCKRVKTLHDEIQETLLTYCVQEFIVFTISCDTLLELAVRRKFPEWDSFKTYVRAFCDLIRLHKNPEVPSKRIYLYSPPSSCIARLAKMRTWTPMPQPMYVPQAYKRLCIAPDMETTLSHMLHAEKYEIVNYVGGIIELQKHLQIPLPVNMYTTEIVVYACESCNTFKSCDETSKKIFGNTLLAFDWNESQPFCHKKDLTGRKPMNDKVNAMLKTNNHGAELVIRDKKNCNQALTKFRLGKFVCHINGVAKLSCRKCTRVCNLSLNKILYGFLCNFCAKPKEDPVVRCRVCGCIRYPSSKTLWTQRKAFANGGLTGCHTYFFCKTHSFQRTDVCAYWALPLLLQMINNLCVKKSIVKLKN